MEDNASMRRPHGTGTLYVQARANGREDWYGRWHMGGRRVNRRLGAKLRRGTGEGLNRTQAEAELRRLMERLVREHRGIDAPRTRITRA
jgi:hypothetical protein